MVRQEDVRRNEPRAQGSVLLQSGSEEGRAQPAGYLFYDHI